MSKVKIELDHNGIRALLRSNEAGKLCRRYADNAVSRLGEGYEADTYVGSGRVNASVMAVSFQAKRDNLKNNSILKALK
ncbi:MAG: hypothetical protein IJT16_02095 [Lachnospiraceae bacterium]|nr:hypothetical protein [Lachnospiraceae bacterium]